MGMFDTVQLVSGVNALSVTCADGHHMHVLQTKDMENGMVTYYVYLDQLFVTEHDDTYGVSTPDDFELIPGKGLAAIHKTFCSPDSHTGDVVVYATCPQCLPIVIQSSRNWTGNVDGRPIWIEYKLTFVDGELKKATPIVRQTRDEFRATLVKDGVGVLPDDDWVAKRFFEMHKESN